jgi:hypothetical protein
MQLIDQVWRTEYGNIQEQQCENKISSNFGNYSNHMIETKIDEIYKRNDHPNISSDVNMKIKLW